VVLKYLVLFALLIVFFYIYKFAKSKQQQEKAMLEGFHQDAPFILKQNENIYDDFYSEIYDELTNAKDRTEWTLLKTMQMTEPTKNNSTILDIGSGTGHLVDKLSKLGYRAFGIDKSKAMVDHAHKKYPDIDIKHNDIQDSMNFERATFTHILCTNFTIYEIQNKNTFFKNCYFWMVPNAYMILHLVDKQEFSAVSPMWRDKIDWKPFFKTKSVRTMDAIAEFDDYQYKSSYQINQSTDKHIVQFKETFTDKQTNNIRQNEQTLYMENNNEILEMANQAGFILHGKVDMKECVNDEHQYLYILERPM
jgi:cyclopropane fatty-acyl-phospholipid synthase-like methyltransferase